MTHRATNSTGTDTRTEAPPCGRRPHHAVLLTFALGLLTILGAATADAQDGLECDLEQPVVFHGDAAERFLRSTGVRFPQIVPGVEPTPRRVEYHFSAPFASETGRRVVHVERDVVVGMPGLRAYLGSSVRNGVPRNECKARHRVHSEKISIRNGTLRLDAKAETKLYHCWSFTYPCIKCSGWRCKGSTCKAKDEKHLDTLTSKMWVEVAPRAEWTWTGGADEPRRQVPQVRFDIADDAETDNAPTFIPYLATAWLGPFGIAVIEDLVPRLGEQIAKTALDEATDSLDAHESLTNLGVPEFAFGLTEPNFIEEKGEIALRLQRSTATGGGSPAVRSGSCRAWKRLYCFSLYYDSFSQDERKIVFTGGDNLWTLAREQYCDGRYWLPLWDYNQDRIDDPHAIADGTVLRLPPMADLGSPEAILARRGDSLWSIAERRLGDGGAFPELARRTGKTLESPDLIYPLQRIHMPLPEELEEEETAMTAGAGGG